MDHDKLNKMVGVISDSLSEILKNHMAKFTETNIAPDEGSLVLVSAVNGVLESLILTQIDMGVLDKSSAISVVQKLAKTIEDEITEHMKRKLAI